MSDVRINTWQSKALDAQNGAPVHISPGLIGLYWLAASLGTTGAWCAASETARHLARRRSRA
jgi:hypothetical protein